MQPGMLSGKIRDRIETSDTGCWLWTGTLNNKGYGQIWSEGRPRLVHRLTYEQIVGPIGEGLSLDHLCHETRCVNPEHLAPVTHKQNHENRKGPQKNSSSGIRGVYWNKRAQRWDAEVRHNGHTVYAGRFDDIKDAEAAAIAKRNELFTHNPGDR